MDTNALQPLISDRYEIEARLGGGSMGQVYRVLDHQTGQVLALKQMMVIDALQEAEIRKGVPEDHRVLDSEFQHLASLRHPNIVCVIDYDFDQSGRPYFTMEYLADAQTVVEYGAGLPAAEKIALLAQLFAAIAYLHENGVLHRDLKPDNLLVVDSELRLLDFGLSTNMTNAGYALQGTAAYMAPELLQGEPPTRATDLYACGVIMYELLAGRHPFDVRNLNQMMLSILYDEPDLTALPVNEPLRELVGRLLSNDLDVRPHDARAVAALLRDIEKEQPVEIDAGSHASRSS